MYKYVFYITIIIYLILYDKLYNYCMTNYNKIE